VSVPLVLSPPNVCAACEYHKCGKRQEARGKRQEARGKRQEARGKRQVASGEWRVASGKASGKRQEAKCGVPFSEATTFRSTSRLLDKPPSPTCVFKALHIDELAIYVVYGAMMINRCVFEGIRTCRLSTEPLAIHTSTFCGQSVASSLLPPIPPPTFPLTLPLAELGCDPPPSLRFRLPPRLREHALSTSTSVTLATSGQSLSLISSRQCARQH
jgi:hypothetical protein